MPADLPSGTVTFLFTDIEGSTRLLEELGSAYAVALEQHRGVIREAIAGHGGVEVDTQGDAFFAVFPSAREAVAAAAEAQRALEFPVRIGLHTGEAELAGHGYVGMDVHRAARIGGAAHGGQVLLSQTTRDLVDVPVRDLGVHRLKDLGQPLPLYQLLGDGLQEQFPALRTLEARPTNLPVQATSLVGREQELDDVGRLLAGTRVLTLTGPGGTGKTRLALQLAADAVDDFRDGVFFVPLAEIDDPALVLPTIAQALAAPERRELADHLRDKEMLVVLDNVEHLVDTAPQLARLVAAAPDLKLVATSRVPLRLSGEQEYPVPPLPNAASVELFVERARAVRPDFALNGHRQAVEEICRRLDSLPLAIELAAARVKLFPPPKLLERLEQRLPLLTGGARDAPARHQTLRAAIDWSLTLLNADEQRLFSRLSVFAGGFTLEAAEAVCDASVDDLVSLVEKSLVTQREGPDGEPRFSMLETVREYARERLDESREADAASDRHADYFLAIAEVAGSRAPDENPEQAADRLYPELDNVRRSLGWLVAAGDAEREVRLATAAFWCLWTRANLREMHGWLASALTRAEQVDDALRADALGAAALAAANHGERELAREHARESLAIARRRGDKRQIEWALRVLSFDEPDLDERRRLLEECERLLRELGKNAGLGWVTYLRGMTFLEEGRFDEAHETLEAAAETFADLGRRWEATNAEVGGAYALIAGGRKQAAQPLLERCLKTAAELESTSLIYEGLVGLAVVRLDAEAATAARLLAAAEILRDEGGLSLESSYARAVLDPATRTARERLGEDYARECAAGGSMTLDEAIALAMGEA